MIGSGKAAMKDRGFLAGESPVKVKAIRL